MQFGWHSASSHCADPRLKGIWKLPQQNCLHQTTTFNKSWAALRGSLFNTIISGQAVSDTDCMKCKKDSVVMCCLDCHLHIRLCGLCDQTVHNFHSFYDHDALKSGFLRSIPPTVFIDSDGLWIFVGMSYN